MFPSDDSVSNEDLTDSNLAENKQEMGKLIADQLAQISPILDKDELEQVVKSSPILVVHPHLRNNSTSDIQDKTKQATGDGQQAKMALLKERLAKLIAEKPTVFSIENSENMGKIIAKELTEINPVVVRDELKQVIGSSQILVVHPEIAEDAVHHPLDGKVGTSENLAKIDLLLEKLAKLVADKPDLVPYISEKSTDTAPAAVPKLHSKHPLEEPTKSMKEMARKIALQLSAMNPTLEKDDLEKAIGSMPVLVLHTDHKHIDESLENVDELVREQQHISEDLEDAEDMAEETQHDTDELDDETKNLEEDPEYPDESIPERQLPDHKHISEDLENADELDVKTVIHEHIEDDLENPEGLIEQEQDLISEDPVIERKTFHKHIDGNMEDVSELVSEEEHEHISEDLENGKEIIAEKLNNHVHKDVDVDEIGRKAGKKLKRPTVDDEILEKSSVTLYGTELISTPTTITLHFQVLGDSGQTAPQ